jgi:putative pyruvate formate lyase activating enzyme
MGNHLLTRITRRDFLKSTAGLCLKIGLSSIFLYSCKPDASRDKTTTAVEKPTTTAVEESGSIGSGFEPAYLKLHKTGELEKRAEELWAIMESCQLCPRRCGVNRLEGMRGFCRAPGATLVVSSFHPHFGEERPLVGNGGSGTIFLTHCNLRHGSELQGVRLTLLGSPGSGEGEAG